MNNLLLTVTLWGGVFLILLFAISVLIVYGVKIFLLTVQSLQKLSFRPPEPQKPAEEPKKRAPAKKSIVINPNEVSRIYVRKDD